MAPDTVRGTTDRKDRRRSAAIAISHSGLCDGRRGMKCAGPAGSRGLLAEGLGRVGRVSP